jgi:glycosyltransferase involved in cell wall biosynthesis
MSLKWISLLMPSFNTPEEFLNECFQSILEQQDLGSRFAIEMVIINDGSNKNYTNILENILNKILIQNKSFIKIKYLKMDINKGISYCLHNGILNCTYDLIFRMDSDDIMHPLRIKKQLEFMMKEPTCVLLGTDLASFINKTESQYSFIEFSNHPSLLTWNEYNKTKKQWILNHPTLCFRKYAVLEVGNYNKNIKEAYEDLELELRILKKYGYIFNLQEVLLYYRIHTNQITNLNRNKSLENVLQKSFMIEQIITNINTNTNTNTNTNSND